MKNTFEVSLWRPTRRQVPGNFHYGIKHAGVLAALMLAGALTCHATEAGADSNAKYNLTGFATVGSGTTGGGVIAPGNPAYVQVTAPLQFASALASVNKEGGVKVIEIMNDLDLGWNEVGPAVQNLPETPFRSAHPPKLHPRLLITGVSRIDIKPKNGGLTIFSANGATLRHATLNIKKTTNIIIRNLKFDEMWEWDETSKGHYDKNDWDFIDLGDGGETSNVWIDHCTFTKSYDGIVDIKGGCSNITFSWCKYVGDDGATNPNSFVRQQIKSLEADHASNPFYHFLRTNGFSTEDIVTIIQAHDKTHLAGAKDLDPKNATLSITFHHQWFAGVWDRCTPRLRAGNAHDYNIYVDDTRVLAAKRLRDARVAAMSPEAQEKIKKTYSFDPPINGSISTEGGALQVEKSVYLDCLWPLRNNQKKADAPEYTGKIQALDSRYTFHKADGTVENVRGNSTDAGNPMGPVQATIIPFSWNLPGHKLPYAYTPDDPDKLLPILEAGAGAGTLTWSKDNWLKTIY